MQKLSNWEINQENHTTQKNKFSIKDFISKCDQIRNFLRNWSHLLKKPLLENFIFVQQQNFNFSSFNSA